MVLSDRIILHIYQTFDIYCREGVKIYEHRTQLIRFPW